MAVDHLNSDIRSVNNDIPTNTREPREDFTNVPNIKEHRVNNTVTKDTGPPIQKATNATTSTTAVKQIYINKKTGLKKL